MSGHKYLADTNTLIFLLDKHPSLQSVLNSDWYFSFITEIELLGKPGITTREIKNIRELLHACNKIVHTEAINPTYYFLKNRNSKSNYQTRLSQPLLFTQICPCLPMIKDSLKSIHLI